MNSNRLGWPALWLATSLLAQAAIAEQPSYHKLDGVVTLPRTLRSNPSMLSRFPTTCGIALSNTGRLIRTVDADGRVWQWELRSNSESALLTEIDSEPACAAFSDDATLLAFAEPDGNVTLLDLQTKQLQFRDATSARRTVTITFSPDSRTIAGVTVDGKGRVWSTGSGEVIREFDAGRGPVQTLAYSPKGELLAVASFSHEVRLFRIQDKSKTEPEVVNAGGRVTALAFSPDGDQLAIATADGTAAVHDLTEEREPTRLISDPFAIWSMTFEPNGERLAAGSWDGNVRLWDTRSWKLLQSVKAHEESVTEMVFDGERGLISAGLDGRLLHWTPELPSIGPSGMIAGRGDSVWVAAYSPNGQKLFVGGREKRFELWDVAENLLLVTRDGHPTTRCAAFSPDSKTLATGGDDGRIFLCDAETGATRTTLRRHPGAVSAVLFADGGRILVSACDGGVVKLWDAITGQEQQTWKEHKQQIYCASFSPDGKWLITGGGNWTTGDPGELIVWDFEDGRVRARVEGHKLAVWTIVFTADGRRFMSSDSSGAVKIWNMETLEEERTLQHATWVRPLALSPAGNTLAVGRGDGSVRLWDTTSWTETGSCDGHEGFTFWLQYAPRGDTLATAGEDGKVKFWRTQR